MSLCIRDYSPARYSISGLRYSCPRKYQLQHWQIALTIRRTHPVDGRAGYNHRAPSKKMIRAPRVTARLRLMGFPREIRSSLAFDQFQGQSIVFLIAFEPPSNIYFTPLVQPRSPMRKHTSFDVNNYDNDITVAKMPQRIAWHRFLQFCTHRKSNALIRVPWIFLPAKNALINELPTVLHL